MNLSLLCVICILQITVADDSQQIGIRRRQGHGPTREAAAGDRHGQTEATVAGDEETRSSLQGGRIFRLSRARPDINIEQKNISEGSDVLSPGRGRARKGVRKGRRRNAKRKGNKASQGRLKQQILSRLVGAEPVPIVKVSD